LFEQRVPQARRTAFNEFTLKVARNHEDEIYQSWKHYLAANPVANVDHADGANSESEHRVTLLIGDDYEAGAGVGAAAADPAAGVEVAQVTDSRVLAGCQFGTTKLMHMFVYVNAKYS
jgi:hypothetical protein